MSDETNNAQAVYAALTNAIIEQALPPGTKLPEELLCKQFQVSRHIVRSAFQLLAADNLVDIRQKKGASVAEPSLEHGRDILRLRMELEDIVVRFVVGKLKKEQADQLRASVEMEHKYVHTDHALYMRHACGFHRDLSRLSGSSTLQRYLAPLLSQSSLVLYMYGRPRWSSCNIDEHMAIIAALEEGDERRSRTAMRLHLEAMFERAFTDAVKDETAYLADVIAKYAVSP